MFVQNQEKVRAKKHTGSEDTTLAKSHLSNSKAVQDPPKEVELEEQNHSL